VNIEIPLQPKQLDVLRYVDYDLYLQNCHGITPAPKPKEEPTIIGVGGSRGSAKSYVGRAIMLLRRLYYPRTAGLIFRRKWKMHVEHTLEAGFFKDFPFMRSWWQESKRRFLLPNGSWISLGIGENPQDIDDYQGAEYMDLDIDEAARLTETELVKVNVARRWTGLVRGRPIPNRLCKTLWLMNPGGPGHNYIRRVMYEGNYQGKERAADYFFLQAHAWDNVEWSRAALAEQGLTDQDYYVWTDRKRFEFFLKFTQYGHELDSLPPRLRPGWLLGDWKLFAGQFFDIWDPTPGGPFVKRCTPDREWHPRWLGIDWGFQHPMSCHWLARVASVTKVYRELVSDHHSARAQAQEIVDRTPGCQRPQACGEHCTCPENERVKIDAIYLSPDAFQRRSEQDSFAEQMGTVFRASGMPYPIPADDDRKHGFQAVYELMKSMELEVDPSCVKLIDTIPMVCTEEDDPEEIAKFEGDDPIDSARYGIKSRQRPGRKPATEVAEERVEKFAEERGTTVEEMDANTLARLHGRALAQEKAKRLRTGARGRRIWHPRSN
jgi:hypothetical protein